MKMESSEFEQGRVYFKQFGAERDIMKYSVKRELTIEDDDESV